MSSQPPVIRGSIVALVTPMHSDGSVDFAALRKLVDWHIEQGTDCISPCGTTGESPTLPVEEHIEIVRTVVEQVAGRVPVMAGAGANSTREAVELTRRCKDVGADCVLSVVPYYNRPTQAGMAAHFTTIAEAVDIPVVLYNVPGRTVADMSVETALRLAQVPGIIGIKEASGNIDRAAQLIRRAPSSFSIYSGDDPTAVALMLLGGHGNISVSANVVPRRMHELCVAAMAGNAALASKLHFELVDLNQQLFCEPNPIPVKEALRLMGRVGAGLRLPLTPLQSAFHPPLRTALQALDLPLVH
ncbi:4-hydroxy-tetrahydrodipicolinate synthase [Thiomonas intermedia]|uniref:4-hydroxy-tetrahydrodipicolinate synthase n=1 Tax=Thiomonas intermedia TaxID=926 RepID=UPI0009A545E2|nr:4-hydroxy-tetrahydrodipicolinate synthase [Thiomonas intermedia]